MICSRVLVDDLVLYGATAEAGEGVAEVSVHDVPPYLWAELGRKVSMRLEYGPGKVVKGRYRLESLA